MRVSRSLFGEFGEIYVQLCVQRLVKFQSSELVNHENSKNFSKCVLHVLMLLACLLACALFLKNDRTHFFFDGLDVVFPKTDRNVSRQESPPMDTAAQAWIRTPASSHQAYVRYPPPCSSLDQIPLCVSAAGARVLCASWFAPFVRSRCHTSSFLWTQSA